MPDHAWQAGRLHGPFGPEWSAELERTWRETLGPQHDPKVSIRFGERRTLTTERGEGEPSRGGVQATAKRRIAVRPHGSEDTDATPELTLHEVIGLGGMGRVFRARQHSLAREVAIKRLEANDDEVPEAVAHFESEARITAWLDHPNIVPIHDMGVDGDGNVFYSMKLVEGTPWDDLIAVRDHASAVYRSLRTHLEVLLEVAHAVAFAHSKGIIHRDIKPENVMVGNYGEVLLVDWGLAVSLRPEDHPPGIFELDEVVVTCGTPAYMPPEIATGQRSWVGPWTDVYMLGASLFELLYERPPHEPVTAIDAIEVASRNAWRFPERVPPERQPYHDVLMPVVARALATRPVDRYRDGEAFGAAVREALANLDAAELASEAIAEFHGIANETAPNVADELERAARYRRLGKVEAVLEQSLKVWPDHAAARHHLVEAHLLHARIAARADDLSLARHHLDALAHLPGGIAIDGEQMVRAEQLQVHIARMLGDRRRRRRHAVVLQASSLASVLLLLVGALVATVLVMGARDQARRERNHLSQLLIATASEGVATELELLFEPVRASLHTAADWARAGRLDGNDPEGLTSFFLPLIERVPVISSVIRADADGREYMLLRLDDGWQIRMTEPGRPTRFILFDTNGQERERWIDVIDYDPHTRPWYQGASALVDPRAIAWTPPYTFYSTKELGITASMIASRPGGPAFVLGIDVSLADLSAYTMRMPESAHGKVFVLSEDDRVLGLPRSEAFATDEARQAAVLKPLAELGEPISARALAAWQAHGRKNDTPVRFDVDGHAWWSGFREFELGPTRRLWIGVTMPEADFVVR